MSQIDYASVLYGQNSTFIAELYTRYLENPAAVDESWRQFFGELQDAAPDIAADLKGPSWAKRQTRIIGEPDPNAPPPAKDGKAKANGKAAPAAAESPTETR